MEDRLERRIIWLVARANRSNHWNQTIANWLAIVRDNEELLALSQS